MQTPWTAVAAGFGAGLSLIVAIGAQNAFVLREGLRRRRVLPLVVICALSDAVLIALGIQGLGTVLAIWPGALRLFAWIGGLFLIGYAGLAARRAWRPSVMVPDERDAGSGSSAVLTCLALTWLNPHVYLDTLLLLGSLANGYGRLRWSFGAGAALSSVVWFTGLGFGARVLSGFFARASSWRVLDTVIAVAMTSLGVRLLMGR